MLVGHLQSFRQVVCGPKDSKWHSLTTHVCVTSDLEATVAVLPDSTTDHYPVITSVKVNKVAPTLKTMERRNFKAMERPALLHSLGAWLWSDVYGIRDSDKILGFVTRGIVNGPPPLSKPLE
jgi:hypothetical protein